MLVTKETLFQFIPQRPPMVMVDGLKEHTAEISLSSFKIESDNIFISNGLLQMPGMIENIAQTAALRNGYDFMIKMQTSEDKAPKPPVGFIGEVKNLIIHFLPAAGETLETKVTLLHNIFTASVVKGVVTYQGTIAAECEMKIFVQP